jgi:hypothetical protein
MSVPRQLAAFAAALAALFGVGLLAGTIAGPEARGDEAAARPAHGADMPAGGGGMAADEHSADGDEHSAAAEGAVALPGLASVQDGLRLVLARDAMPLGRGARLALRILGPDGRAVTDFDVEHTKRLHLIVVRRDLTGFRHLHPAMGSDGTWRTRLRLDSAGSYRVFADFSTGGTKRTLGGDLSVPGDFRPHAIPAHADRATVGGYEVTRTGGRFEVRRDGRPVDVEPYLGARGHLVVLRAGDLAYLHVHPLEAHGREIPFAVEYPSPGRYRLFLQFKHDGRVHTAAFTSEP